MTDSAHAKYREARAVELKMTGGTYQQIADELGYASRSGAWHAVDRALSRRTTRAVEAYVSSTLVDLDLLHERSWPAAMAGDSRAIGRCLQTIENRSRLLRLC